MKQIEQWQQIPAPLNDILERQKKRDQMNLEAAIKHIADSKSRKINWDIESERQKENSR